AGDVAHRQALEAALVERAGRLALEVDDHEVVAGVQDLAEVIVAVDSDAGRVQTSRQERSKDVRDPRLEVQHLASFLASLRGQLAELRAKPVGGAQGPAAQ